MMFYNNSNNSSHSPTQQNSMYESQFMINQQSMYDQDLFSTSPQQVYATSLSPQLDMLNHMNDLTLNNVATNYNSSPDSNASISTDIYTQDFSWSDPMLPDLYPKPKPLPIKIQKLSKESSTHAQQKKAVDPETHRRQLDEKLGKINFDDITVAELKEVLRERGLPATGRKAELMSRLKEEFDLVINQRQPHVLLNRHRRLGEKKSSSPKLAYHPYYTPPLRHASLVNTTNDRLASSLPTSTNPFLNDQFMKPSSSLGQFMQPNVPYKSDDIWDDQMLENFLNQI